MSDSVIQDQAKNARISLLISICLIFLFLISEKISIFKRLPDFDLSITYLIKIGSIVVIWLIALIAIYFVARSQPFFKWGGYLIIIFSTLVFDIFSGVTDNTLLYGDYLGLRIAVSFQDIRNVFIEYGKFFLYPCLRALLLFIAFIILQPTLKKNELKASLLLSCSFVIFVVLLIKQETSVRRLPGFLSIAGFEIGRLFDQNKYSYNYEEVLFEPHLKPKRQNILLIIDESVRYDFINGGEYSPEFNVKSNSNWNVYDYGSATSGNNCSGYSNLILRKGPRPNRLTIEIQSNPLIWAYAKKAGFRTTLIDAQRSGKGHDYFDINELKMIDNNINTDHYRSDLDIVVALKELLKTNGNFVIIIKKGAHFPYSLDYPKAFMPNFRSAYINQKQKRIEYARAIMYQTMGFFEEILKLSLSPSTLMVYTSDHGQNLEDMIGSTHCTMSSDPYQGEGMVPMLVIDNQHDQEIVQYKDINYNKTSHFNIFSTLLYYLGYDRNDYLRHYTPSLVDPEERLGKFNYGSPFGYFGSKPVFKTADQTINYIGAKN